LKRTLQLVELLSRRYPKRNQVSNDSSYSLGRCSDGDEGADVGENFDEKTKDDKTNSDESKDDDDEFSKKHNDSKEDDGHNDSDEDDVDTQIILPRGRSVNSKRKVVLENEKERKRKRRRKRLELIHPNGKYPDVDFEKIARERNHNIDYDIDVTTDSGNYRDGIWNKRFREYLAYYRKYKTHAIKKINGDHRKLIMWQQMQRSMYKCKLLHPDRFRRLNSIDFVWVAKDGPTWFQVFQKLISFKKKYGHTDIPKRYKDDPQLGLWCRHQRAIYNHERYIMSPDRVNHLESIGFKWVARPFQWKSSFDDLVSFKKKHGHFNVPPGHSGDLSRWVRLRREEYARKTLPKEQIEKLDEIKFDWKL